MAKGLAGSLHAHGCTHCGIRYEDACADPGTDGRCTACRGGRPWLLLIDGASPKDCCRETARLARKDEKKTYRLAGTRLWHICTACKRTHPFNPRTETTPEPGRKRP